ncbi:universal stress protein [Gordonia sp. (in: high G+C Gram-positive bacteria)]|uniref:universal stress protein n=1 Tax=Gordonia sp. (in: high G+C Gram-positive bacteria) TaxID=84139 RepID=UPI00261C7604|nr:universal stress protein [Gordonia sp. (in: high G+C Gram-positive bacteria)]
MRIYVAYLATDGGADAVAMGVRLARTLTAGLDIGMVLPPDAMAPLHAGDFEQVLTEQADQWLAQARAMVPDDIDVATHIAFSESSAEGIIGEAQRVGASAIVVGGSGGGLVGGHTLGSVVNELVHSSPLPLVLSPRGLRRSKVQHVRAITCAMGRRAGAQHLLDTAIRAAARSHSPLRVVSLIALDRVPHGHKPDDQVIAEATAHAQSAFDEARSRIPVDTDVSWTIVSGPTVEDAVNKLDWHDGDIIMVGSSRLAAQRRLFLSSTAAKMLRVLDVPMVIVPKEES